MSKRRGIWTGAGWSFVGGLVAAAITYLKNADGTLAVSGGVTSADARTVVLDGSGFTSQGDGTVILTGGVQPVTKVLAIVGDSLTVGSISNGFVPLVTAMGYSGSLTSNNGTRAIVDGTTLRMDALVGRGLIENSSPYPTPGSLDVINAWRSAGWHPNSWVVGLISNNFGQSLTTLKASINTLVNLIAADGNVPLLWVGPVLANHATQTLKDQLPTMYQALNEVAAARSDVSMSVFDLSSALHNGRDESTLWQMTDTTGRHMTNEGYVLRGQLIRDAMITKGM